jgi:hypothetical protein
VPTLMRVLFEGIAVRSGTVQVAPSSRLYDT